MRRKQRKWNRVLFAVCLLIFLMQTTAYAEEKGSIRVIIMEELDQQSVSGSTVYLHQVARENDSYELVYMNAFSGVEITEHELFHEDHVENAQILYQYILDNRITGQEKITGQDGKVVFENLEEGAYLIHGKKGERIGFQPFLVFMPTEIDAVAHYHVQATPKTKNQPQEQEKDEESESKETVEIENVSQTEESVIPQTGENMILVYVLIALGTLFMLWGIADITHRGADDE